MQPSGFFLNRGPRIKVFVCGVEVKSTSHEARDLTLMGEPL